MITEVKRLIEKNPVLLSKEQLKSKPEEQKQSNAKPEEQNKSKAKEENQKSAIPQKKSLYSTLNECEKILAG